MLIRWIIWIEALAICVILFFAAKSSLQYEPQQLICDYYENGAIRECAKHDVVSAYFIRTVAYLDEHDGTVVGTFTIFLAA
ncbi:MAG TPA: hypothetical protein VLB05_09065, partial [Dongiaceae bacterium]|nr:hypothetical protein [Dongiaceae bacterium]